MRFGTAIELLVDNYQYAKSKIWIRDEVAWALYHTWKEADRKTENSSEKPNNCEECKHWNDTEDGCADRHGCKTCRYGEVDEGYVRCAYYSKSTEPTTEDCSMVDWKDEMWTEAIVTEPTTQTETQNSNLTFEKRTMRDCYNCKKYEAEGECIECKFEPKDEPQTERSGE